MTKGNPVHMATYTKKTGQNCWIYKLFTGQISDNR